MERNYVTVNLCIKPMPYKIIQTFNGWRGGAMVRRRTYEFDPRPRRGCVTTLGKLFTPMCLDADSLRYFGSRLFFLLYLLFTNKVA